MSNNTRGIPTTRKALCVWLDERRATLSPEANRAGRHLVCALDQLGLHRRSDKGFDLARANVDVHLVKFLEAWRSQ